MLARASISVMEIIKTFKIRVAETFCFPFLLPIFFAGIAVLMFLHKDQKPFASVIVGRIPSDARSSQRLRKSHGSNKVRLFLYWATRLGHAEGA